MVKITILLSHMWHNSTLLPPQNLSPHAERKTLKC